MHARVTTLYMRQEHIDKAVEIYRDSVIPAARKQKGFISGSAIVDRETGKGLVITVWESEEDIQANEANQYYQEQLLKLMVTFTKDPMREAFEVVYQS
jgi:heme-degrading monooxygenase HmoA